MSYLFLILIYYLMLFSPSFVASPFSLLIALPFLFFSRARKKAILYMFLMLSASRILDVSLFQIPFSMDNVREVGIIAIEDGAVKRYGKYGFPAQLYYAHDGFELFSSASGEIYVYSAKEEIRAGDSLSCHGSFRKGNFFTADKVFAIEDGALRKVRKHGEAILRKRLSLLPEEEGNLALMLLLALSDDGEAEVTALGREKGVSHVFALSGMHLSLISSLLIPLISSIAGRRRAEKIVMLPLLAFTFLSGFRASLLRALIFRALFTFFPSMEREDHILSINGEGGRVCPDIFHPCDAFPSDPDESWSGFLISFGCGTSASLRTLGKPFIQDSENTVLLYFHKSFLPPFYHTILLRHFRGIHALRNHIHPSC